jgi:hypothetical protein
MQSDCSNELYFDISHFLRAVTELGLALLLDCPTFRLGVTTLEVVNLATSVFHSVRILLEDEKRKPVFLECYALVLVGLVHPVFQAMEGNSILNSMMSLTFSEDHLFKHA